MSQEYIIINTFITVGLFELVLLGVGIFAITGMVTRLLRSI